MELDRKVQEIENTVGPLAPEQREAVRLALANFGMACCMDSEVRKEIVKVCESADKVRETPA